MLNFNNNMPIYIQVIDTIKQDIVKGILKSGEKMPSSRDLSMQIGINMNTVARVYKELEMDGIVFTKRGIGTFVTESKETILRIKNEYCDNLIKDFVDGMKNIGLKNKEIMEIINNRLEDYEDE